MMNRIAFLALFLIPTLAMASPSRMKIAADNEPGQRMIITGHVLSADGKPLGGLKMFAYHTDSRGEYGRDSNGVARLHGTLVTATDGSYLIDTIKPGPYPGGQVPAHVHIQITGPGVDQPQLIEFKDPIRPEADGVYHIRRDFRLRSK